MKNKIQWIIAIISFLLAVACFGVSSLFFLIGGILLLPIDSIRNFLQDKVKIKEMTAWILAVVFMFIGCITISTKGIEQAGNISESTYSAAQSSGKGDSSSSNRIEKDSSSSIGGGTSSSNNRVEEDSSSNRTSDSSFNNTSIQITYILNTSTKKIHYQTCSQVGRISASNKATSTKSIEELRGEGYTTCGICF